MKKIIFKNRRITALMMVMIMTLSVLLVPSTVKAESAVKDRNWRAYCTTYVFDQMNADQKELYNNLENVCMEFVKSDSIDATYMETEFSDGSKLTGYYLKPVEYSNLTNEQLAEVVQLFVYQNPQYYFTSIGKGYLQKSRKITKTSILGTETTIINELYLPCFDAFAKASDRTAITNDLFSKVDAIVTDIGSKYSKKYDIEKAVHDAVCEKTDYIDGEYSQSIYSVLEEGKSVCLGYSLTCELLLNALGVPAVTTYSDKHAWNKVLLDDGKWYAFDATWADQASGIWYGCFNKSDSGLADQDSDDESMEHYQAHVIKSPEFFPACSDNYSNPGVVDDVEVVVKVVAQNDDSTSVETDDQYVSIAADEIDKPVDQDMVAPEVVEATESKAYDASIDEDDEFEEEEEIELDPTKISKIKAETKKCTIKWKKIKNIDGYEIQLSTSKKFKKIAKKAKVSAAKTSSTIKKLKKKTTYYVRIRTYKNVDGITYTSDWSGIKKVTIR